MTRTKLILASLIGGAMAFGVACSSDKAAQRSTDPSVVQNPAPPRDTGGSGQQTEEDINEHVPQEDRLGTGGTGYEEDYPQDSPTVAPEEDSGIGGSGPVEDVPRSEDDDTFSGDINPSDEVIPE